MTPNYHGVEFRVLRRLLLNNYAFLSCIAAASRQPSISSRLVSISMFICFIAMALLVSIWILCIRFWASILCRSTQKEPSANLMIASAIYVAFPMSARLREFSFSSTPSFMHEAVLGETIFSEATVVEILKKCSPLMHPVDHSFANYF